MNQIAHIEGPITEENSIVFRSYFFAVKAHGNQQYDGKPYSVHLRDVAKITEEHYPEYLGAVHSQPIILDLNEIQAVAFLHDVLEDTNIGYEAVENAFPTIAPLVWNLTDERGENRKERKRKTWHKIRKSPASVFVKLADRISNTEASVTGYKPILSMYQKEFPLFEAALYVPGQFEGMWERLRQVQK